MVPYDKLSPIEQAIVTWKIDNPFIIDFLCLLALVAVIAVIAIHVIVFIDKARMEKARREHVRDERIKRLRKLGVKI